MKINFIVPSIKNGGGYRVIQESANELAKRGHDVIIYSSNDGTSNTFPLNNKVRMKKYGPLIKNKYIRLFNMIYMLWSLRKKKNCIVSGPVLLPFLFFYKNINYYCQADDYHLFDDKRLIKYDVLIWLYHYMIKRAYQYKNVNFIFNSKWVYDKFLKISNRNDVPYIEITPAISMNVIDEKRVFNDKITIGTIGRRQPMKGFSDFVEAINKIPIDLKKNIHIVVAYTDELSTPVPMDWEMLQPKNDFELMNFYTSCDVFVSTSWWEGFGLPALEAMKCGCAVITSDNGGCSAYAKNNINCLIYPPKDIPVLTDKICKIISDKSLQDRLVKEGIQTAKYFDWSRTAMQIESILYV